MFPPDQTQLDINQGSIPPDDEDYPQEEQDKQIQEPTQAEDINQPLLSETKIDI